MAGGLELARSILPPREAGERQIVVLMSDGQPNVGVSTKHGLASIARAIRDSGAGVSTLGFGAHHDEAVLEAIAEGGGGRYAFVNDVHLAQASFARALGAQLDVVAEQIELLIAPAEGTRIVRVLGDARPSFGADGLRLTLPDAVAGDAINVVVELDLTAPREIGPWAIMEAELAYRPAGGGDRQTSRARVELRVTSIEPRDPEPQAHAIATVALAAEKRTQALALTEKNALAAALALLREASAALTAARPACAGHEAAIDDALESIDDDIVAIETKPDPEAMRAYRKVAKDYGDMAVGFMRGTRLAASSPAQMAMSRACAGGVPAHTRLVGVSGDVAGSVFPLDRAEVDIGRSTYNAIPLRASAVSKVHARLVSNGTTFTLVDLGSTCGTFVNGERIASRTLSHGDVIRIGSDELRYEQSP
jgi:Ca-activated chloride channel family protein